MIDKQELIRRHDEVMDEITRLQDIVSKLSEEIKNIKKDNKKSDRYIPKIGDVYYYVDSCGKICSCKYKNTIDDYFRISTGNCFRTLDETEDYVDNLMNKQKLKDLALELDGGKEVDWEKIGEENIYYIMHNWKMNGLTQDTTYWFRDLGQVYCMNEDFLSKAIERIGEDKLMKLLKSGV